MPPGNIYPTTRANFGCYQWFQSQLGRQMPDYGPEPKRWNTDRREAVHDIINRGVQQVYYPTSVLQRPFKWSWLTTEFELVLAADNDRYTLEPDIAGTLGPLIFSNDSSIIARVDKVGYDTILKHQMISTSTGFPAEYAELPIAPDGTQGQQLRLVFWPVPDSTYTLRGVADLVPADLTEENPWPPGSRFMTETYLASMESLLDPKKEDRFKSRLMASINADMSRRTGENLGTMTNGGEMWGSRTPALVYHQRGTVSYQ